MLQGSRALADIATNAVQSAWYFLAAIAFQELANAKVSGS
jgi:hypothetical protein